MDHDLIEVLTLAHAFVADEVERRALHGSTECFQQAAALLDRIEATLRKAGGQLHVPRAEVVRNGDGEDIVLELLARDGRGRGLPTSGAGSSSWKTAGCRRARCSGQPTRSACNR